MNFIHVPNVIVGAGIAGLYLASELKKRNENFIIIEKNNYVGGRTKSVEFHGQRLTLGAGIIEENNVELISLCKDLNLELIDVSGPTYMHNAIKVDPIEQIAMIKKITKVYHSNESSIKNMTCKEFFDLYFSAEFIKKFKDIVLFNDFWNADVHQTIKYYPLDEFITKDVHSYSINGGWYALVEKFKTILGSDIKLNEEVVEINGIDKYICTTKNKYAYNKLFLCTDISITKAKLILPDIISNIINHIGSVPFLRLYIYSSEPSSLDFSMVPGIMSKILPITKNITMSSYTDSFNADDLRNYLINSSDKLSTINTLVQNAIDGDPNIKIALASDYVYHYWENGIHYFKPGLKEITEITHDHDIYLVGEMTSDRQGWVEGAVRSVNKVCLLLFN